jgi:mannitol/fructose-specific phosphotransferase system IIA component (Ntr-type)
MNANATNPQSSLHLTALLSEKTVGAKVSVSSWETATDTVGDLLVKANKIERRYVLAMKRVLKELGPYAVLAPGIVLLHARPDDGVREACLGLISLAEPVEFGHSENDPVDLVFALGAIDKQGHIAALQELAGLLGNPDKLKELRSAQTNQTLYQALVGNLEVS